MNPTARGRIADRLSDFEASLEVGIGENGAVAAALRARGRDVTAMDVSDAAAEAAPEGVRFRRADVTEIAAAADPMAALALPRAPGVVYACNLPAELQRPTLRLAERLDAVCAFTTLGFEEPVVPVRRRHAVGSDTLYVVRGRIGSD
ncbi:UPF0146 family protein [Haloparvum sedimenti]|uniref:UPF0146 family protein n=1 Tax=Haloparvum sedimenti TaxID=1678448 RepID=UPI00071E7335|nr:UPF0146 family protein [Haloparvum sedimenti]